LDSDLLQNSLDNIDLAIEEIRKLSHTLVAPSLGNITLIEAIRDLVSEIRLVTPLQLKLITGNFNEKVLNKNIKLMFYRIVQEQLHNILKHAQAKNAGIELSTTSHTFRLTIKDDGVGFDSSKKEEGIGLRNIRNRVEFYDGCMRIISTPGMGCTLEVSVPVT
jgi:two-component system sensor histidine kinase UhpB